MKLVTILMGIWILFCMACAGGLIYAVFHFAAKYW